MGQKVRFKVPVMCWGTNRYYWPHVGASTQKPCPWPRGPYGSSDPAGCRSTALLGCCISLISVKVLVREGGRRGNEESLE